MEVILLENISKLGKLGETVNVKAGFGRNFLIPRGKAVHATEANTAEFETRRAELRGRNSGWLTGFYLVWLIFDPVKLLVVFFSIADSWLNFRQRWSPESGTEVNSPDERDD